MTTSDVRVRFAPSPTGFMHLGNVRAALMNYLFAQQKQGIFILRIEDTDATRNIDPMGTHIIQDLAWLGLQYQEGPVKNGPYAPYYQSQRTEIYQKYLELFKEKNLLYRCFCTSEELEKKRQRQLALKNPPRYDRACAVLNQADITKQLEQSTPFIWRFKLDYNASVSFFDLAHKTMHFELKHFSDIPFTRQDGSFTFMFANFVDDVEMRITHVFRGEDHLTNTAAQVALYQALGVPVPVFWHLPIICNQEGKKLSKRDFGFSLTDLKNGGFLPEALCNYLAIIGASFGQELMNMPELIKAFNFDTLSATGQIKYDLEKLKWINHHWIMQATPERLAHECRPFLEAAYPGVSKLTDTQLTVIIKYIQPELITLLDSVSMLEFYFTPVTLSREVLESHGLALYQNFFVTVLETIQNLGCAEDMAKTIQVLCKEQKLPIREVFTLIRLALTGKPQGLSIKDLLLLLGTKESYKRLQKLI